MPQNVYFFIYPHDIVVVAALYCCCCCCRAARTCACWLTCIVASACYLKSEQYS